MQSPYHHHKKMQTKETFLQHSIKQTTIQKYKILKKLNKNPTNQLKSKINKLITAYNAECNSTKLPKIISDYKPGYLYGTVKIHKPNHPLCPIISQMLTPIYELTKTIKQLITPYLPVNITQNLQMN